jgi:hypothetical protein
LFLCLSFPWDCLAFYRPDNSWLPVLTAITAASAQLTTSLISRELCLMVLHDANKKHWPGAAGNLKPVPSCRVLSCLWWLWSMFTDLHKYICAMLRSGGESASPDLFMLYLIKMLKSIYHIIITFILLLSPP